MRYKWLFVLLFFFVSSGYSADRWNVLMADWKDLSEQKDQNIGLMIKKSIAVQLAKDPNFRVWISTNTPIYPDDVNDVILQGRTNKADIVATGDYFYGNYYIHGKRLVIVVELYDVLEKRLKVRKVYTGTITEDIFDTVDSMTMDLKESVVKEFPPLEGENEVRIKKVREVVYGQEKLKLKRMFYTRLGAYTELGHKFLSSTDVSQPPMGPAYTNHNLFDGQIPLTSPAAGLMIRLWDFRFDLLLSGFSGMPMIDWRTGSQAKVDMINSMNLIGLTYYLPWFNNSIAIGAAFQMEGVYKKMQYDSKVNQTNFDRLYEVGVFPASLYLIWNPSPDLELSLIMSPDFWKMNSTRESTKSGGSNSTKVMEYHELQYMVPPIQAGAICFFGDFGVEARVNGYWAVYHMTTKDADGNALADELSSDVTQLGFYLGMVYRVNFLNQ